MSDDYTRQLYADGLNLPMIQDETAHVAPGAWTPPDHFRYFRHFRAMVPEQPGILSIDHEEPRTFAATRSGVSTCLPTGNTDKIMDIGMRYRIPMGYTTLDLREKRAVVHRGRLLRLWPRQSSATSVHLLLAPVADGRHGNLALRTGDLTWHAVNAALDLSVRTESPIVVASLIDWCDWH